MIINKSYLINITNRNVASFIALGYVCKTGDRCLVKLKDVPNKTNIECICDDCSLLYTVSKARLNETNSNYCKVHRWEKYSKSRKEYWSDESTLEVRQLRGLKISKIKKGVSVEKCRGSNNGNWNPNKSKQKEYYSKVRSFTLANFKKEIDKLPNKNLSGKCGVEGAYQLDHKVSIKFGFDNNIPYEIIGHICNLEMIPWEKNRRKDSKNSIDLEMLNLLIEKHDRKNYGSY